MNRPFVKLKIAVTFALLIFSVASKAQVPTYSCEIRNEAFVSSSVFEFDVYITQTGSTPLELAGFNTGIKINPSFINGGSVTPALVPGSSELISSQAPVAISYDAPTNCIKIAPTKPPRDYGSGVTSGSLISSTTGTKICRVQLTNSVDFGADPINYTFNTDLTPYRTVVAAFLPGATPKVNAAITDANSHPKSANVTAFLQGLYIDGLGNRKTQDEIGDHFAGPVSDLVTIKLAESTSPFAIVHTAENINLYSNGKASFTLPSSLTGSYYVIVNHRNSLETWSADPVDFSGTSISYNFTDASTKAFGTDAMVEVAPGVFAFYVGDVTADGLIDGDDLAFMDPDIIVGNVGYLLSDLNGDGLVDGDDLAVSDSNIIVGIASQYPF